MKQPSQKNLPRELETARRRVDAWRSTQDGVRRRIPEKIWSEALSLTSRHSFTKVSSSLGVPYESLRKRARQSQPGAGGGGGRKAPVGGRSRRKTMKQRFVELPQTSQDSSKSGVTSIEMRSPGGATLVVRTASANVADVAAALWREIS